MKDTAYSPESIALGGCILSYAVFGVVQITTIRSLGGADAQLLWGLAFAVGLPLLALGVLWVATLVFRKWVIKEHDWHVKAGALVTPLLLALATVLVLMMFTDFSSTVNSRVPVPISQHGYVREQLGLAWPYFAVVLGGILYVRVARFRASRATKSMRTAQRPVPTFGE